MTETLMFDRSDRLRMRVNGPKAAEMVNGLVTNDVAALAPGQGLYAVALTAKSKIVADLRIFRGAESVFVDASARAGQGWMEMVRKYINPRIASYADISPEIGDVGVYGPDAERITASVTEIPEAVLGALEQYSHVESAWGVVAKVPDGGVDGFEIFPAAGQIQNLKNQLMSLGAREGSVEDWQLLRIRALRPEWGIDMNDETLPQEANMDELGAISYNKGCYIGQETVARIHFRGHVNKHLRLLSFESGSTPPEGAELLDAEGKLVGDVRSAIANVGIGMVRREVPSGSSLTASQGEAVTQVTVQ